MATVEAVKVEIIERGDHGHILTWIMDAGDTAKPIRMIGSSRRTVQIVGLSGSDKIRIEGSNNDVDYSILTDPHGNQLVFNKDGISTVRDLAAYTRPAIHSGSPTGVKVILLVRKESR